MAGNADEEGDDDDDDDFVTVVEGRPAAAYEREGGSVGVGRAIAESDFHAIAANQLALSKGDEVIILTRNAHPGWDLCSRKESAQIGLVPSRYLIEAYCGEQLQPADSLPPRLTLASKHAWFGFFVQDGKSLSQEDLLSALKRTPGTAELLPADALVFDAVQRTMAGLDWNGRVSLDVFVVAGGVGDAVLALMDPPSSSSSSMTSSVYDVASRVMQQGTSLVLQHAAPMQFGVAEHVSRTLEVIAEKARDVGEAALERWTSLKEKAKEAWRGDFVGPPLLEEGVSPALSPRLDESFVMEPKE